MRRRKRCDAERYGTDHQARLRLYAASRKWNVDPNRNARDAPGYLLRLCRFDDRGGKGSWFRGAVCFRLCL
jgi:hypothetical protein